MFTPSTTGKVTAGGADVLILNSVAAQPIFNHFRDLSDSDNPNRAVEVSVTNGSGRSAQAQVVLDSLSKLGFLTDDSGDATNFHNSRTTIRYAPGQAGRSAVGAIPALQSGVRRRRHARRAPASSWPPEPTSPACSPRPRPASDFTSFLSTTSHDRAARAPAGSATTTSVPSMVPSTPPGQLCG